MRTEDQIQRAHDIFAAIVLGDVPSPFGHDPDVQRLCVATLDALCWCLRHNNHGKGDGGKGLAANLERAEEWLAQRGYVLGEQK